VYRLATARNINDGGDDDNNNKFTRVYKTNTRVSTGVDVVIFFTQRLAAASGRGGSRIPSLANVSRIRYNRIVRSENFGYIPT